MGRRPPRQTKQSSVSNLDQYKTPFAAQKKKHLNPPKKTNPKKGKKDKANQLEKAPIEKQPKHPKYNKVKIVKGRAKEEHKPERKPKHVAQQKSLTQRARPSETKVVKTEKSKPLFDLKKGATFDFSEDIAEAEDDENEMDNEVKITDNEEKEDHEEGDNYEEEIQSEEMNEDSEEPSVGDDDVKELDEKDLQEEPEIKNKYLAEKAKKQKKEPTNAKQKMLLDARRLWEDVRMKNPDKDKQPKLVQLLNLLKGHEQEVALKRDASKILQSCLEFGTPEQKDQIFEDLKDNILVLAQNKYGTFLLKKMFSCANKAQANFLWNQCKGNFVKLSLNKNSAKLVDHLYVKGNAERKGQIISEFYGAEYRHFAVSETKKLSDLLAKKPHQKTRIIEGLRKNIHQLLHKDLLKYSFAQHLVLQYLPLDEGSERNEILSSLSEVLVNIIHQKMGAKIAELCLLYGTAKDRKQFLKSIKTVVSTIAKNEYGYLVLLRAFSLVDDVVRLQEILTPLVADFLDVGNTKLGRLIYLYILSPKAVVYFKPLQNRLGTSYINSAGETVEACKKDLETKCKELTKFVNAPLVQKCAANCRKVLESPFLGDVIVELTGRSDEELRQKLYKAILHEIEITEEGSLFEHPSAHSVLKRLVYVSNRLDKDSETSFSQQLFNYLKVNSLLIELSHKDRASFVIAALFESQFSQQVKDELRDEKDVLLTEEVGQKRVASFL